MMTMKIKQIRFGEDYSKQQRFDDERAADEDALCDDPDANFDVCQSATLAFASSDKDKDDLTKHDVDVLCDATEDYKAHKEQCDKLYDKVQDATLAFASSEEEEHCEDNNGQWSKEERTCNFDDKDDKQDYQKEKHDYFAAKPENQGYSDWEYDEEDK